MLRGTDRARHLAAADWLAKQPPDENRQGEVSKALNPLLPEPKTREAGVKALARWATRENVPGLLGLLGEPSPAIWKSALAILGRLQDRRAAGPLAKLLFDPERRAGAVQALRELGQAAGEKEVLTYLHHKDEQVRALVADLLRHYGTADPALLDQTITDLGSTEVETRRLALGDLARRKRDDERGDKVASELEQLLTHRDGEIKKAALRALGVWASKKNAKALVSAFADPDLKDDAIALLGKLKAEQAVPALLSLFPGPDRAKVTKALGQIGPPGEKSVLTAVLSVVRQPDPNPNNVVRDLIRLLGDIGTREVSLPGLESLHKDLSGLVAALRKKRANPLLTKSYEGLATECKAALKKVQRRK
jgi:HEAT repeat protein